MKHTEETNVQTWSIALIDSELNWTELNWKRNKKSYLSAVTIRMENDTAPNWRLQNEPSTRQYNAEREENTTPYELAENV